MLGYRWLHSFEKTMPAMDFSSAAGTSKKQAQNGLASAKPLLVSSIALRRAEAAFALPMEQLFTP